MKKWQVGQEQSQGNKHFKSYKKPEDRQPGHAGGKTGSPGLPVAGLPVAPAVHCVTTTFLGTPKVV